MADNLKLKIEGNIKVTKTTKNIPNVIFDDHNALGPDAAQIVVRCLSQLDFEKSISGIRARGTFGEFIGETSAVIYNATENSMVFRIVFYEFDFDGTVEEMELLSGPLGNAVMATKDAISITKDSNSRLQIDWKIIIALC